MSLNTLDYFLKGLLECGVTDLNAEIQEFLSPVDRDKLKQAVDNLDQLKAEKNPIKGSAKQVWQGEQNRKVGAAFERLIGVLFEKSQVLTVRTNLHSTTGEIDLVMELRPLAQKVPFLASRTHLIAEAKSHDKSPKSEWVTETLGNLKLHGCNLAFIFVYCKPKRLQREFRQAVAMAAASGNSVVPIGRKQYGSIADGAKLIDTISRQYVDCATHNTDLHV